MASPRKRQCRDEQRELYSRTVHEKKGKPPETLHGMGVQHPAEGFVYRVVLHCTPTALLRYHLPSLVFMSVLLITQREGLGEGQFSAPFKWTPGAVGR